MNIKSKKKELRRLIAERRTSADPALLAEESARLVQEIEESEFFKAAGCVMAYWPMKGELDLRALIIKHHPAKRFVLPVVAGDVLELRLFEGEARLVTGSRYGILEPDGATFRDYAKIDLVLVPGVAFDREGYRLGHGMAYYDRLLPRLTRAHKVGVGFDFQLVESVPVEPHDEVLDAVVVPGKQAL